MEHQNIDNASTVVPSKAPSDMEKANLSERASSRSSSRSGSTPATTTKLDENVVEKSLSRTESYNLAKVVTREEPTEYPSGLKLFSIMTALALVVLCVALDNTIIATAIPRITDEFQALDSVGWFGSAYLLTTCALQLFFGRLYSLFDIKWTFLIALLWFEVGSAICGAAPNATALIIGRAVAGVGSAGLFSGALIILAFSAPIEKRPAYTGIIGGMYGIASVVGPLLGGVFTDHATWRWCFYINLPLGAVTAGIIMLFFTSPKTVKQENIGLKARIMKFDPVGTPIFFGMIISLLLALQWGGTTYPWSNGRIIALFTVFAILLVAFVAIQFWAGDNATVPIRIAKQRSIAAASAFAFCLGSSFFLFVYYIPIWFQAVKGVSAVRSGIDNLPMLLAVTIASVIGGGLVTKFGHYVPFFYVSVVLASIGAGLLTLFTPDIGTSKWIGFQIVYGLGVGFGLQQSIVVSQTVLDITDIPIGTSIVIFFQMLGGALFVSVGQNIFSNKLVEGLSGIQGLDAQAIVHTGATEISKLITDPAQLGLVIDAYNGALVKAFQIGLIMACLATIGAVSIEWRSVKGKKIEGGLA